MRRFDGIEDAPAQPRGRPPKPARRWAFGGRPQLGALVTASLVLVIGLPAALIAIRDSELPRPVQPPKAAPSRPSAAPTADNATAGPAEPDQAVSPIQIAPQPPANTPAPNRRMTPSDSSEGAVLPPSPVTAYAPASPSSVMAAAPPPPPPPASPAQDQAAGLAAEESAGDSEIVVTGSMIASPNALDQQLRGGRGRSNSLARKANERASAPKWVLDDPAYRGFLAQLQAGVRANDRATVVRLVRLPLRVNFAGSVKTYRDAKSVRAEYDRIFTPGVKSAILGQRFEDLLGRDQGVMIGNGAVWFDHVCRNQSCSPPGPVRINAINP
ncbi:MAG TPA: hypothetical protein VM757_07120 [Sphingomicrobium sp.]|nr:hypothetical protein [Sphingomicrobium sp.]